jgi:hypothetical protein
MGQGHRPTFSSSLARYPFAFLPSRSVQGNHQHLVTGGQERDFPSKSSCIKATQASPSLTLISLPLSLRVHRRHRRKSSRPSSFTFSLYLDRTENHRHLRASSPLRRCTSGQAKDTDGIPAEPSTRLRQDSELGATVGERSFPQSPAAGVPFSEVSEADLHVCTSPPRAAPPRPVLRLVCENHPRQPPRERPLPPSPIDQ